MKKFVALFERFFPSIEARTSSLQTRGRGVCADSPASHEGKSSRARRHDVNDFVHETLIICQLEDKEVSRLVSSAWSRVEEKTQNFINASTQQRIPLREPNFISLPSHTRCSVGVLGSNETEDNIFSFISITPSVRAHLITKGVNNRSRRGGWSGSSAVLSEIRQTTDTWSCETEIREKN